jgi:hypothetical protein
MMFYLLATALCLAVAFLVLGVTSLICIPLGRLLGRKSRFLSVGVAANLLFAIRLLPLGLACLVSLGFALPAFVEFEPEATGEGISWRLLILAAFGASAVFLFALRAIRILAATYSMQRKWIACSQRLAVPGVASPVHCVESHSSVLAVTGLLRPQVFVARKIVESLSADELAAALAHEMAHVASHDNLKQLLLRVTRLPRWLNYFHTDDAAWLSASEVAADQAALEGGASVLDLSSALVKVGRLTRPAALNPAVAASHLLPPACATSLEARVLRLREALENSEADTARQPRRPRHRWMALVASAALVYAVAAHALLPAIHEALEVLVR